MTAQDLVVFVGNARCYHTMDWYRSAQQVCAPRKLVFATDLIESEGHVRLVRDDDEIIPLLNVDALLLRRQSAFGNVWRNAVKFGLLPIQVLLLRRLYRRMPEATYHAHTMYYMLACWMAGVPFVGTPQGSEILVRPHRSRVYRWFAARALRAAETVTVDSEPMRAGVLALSGRDAAIVQNGIDVAAIMAAGAPDAPRTGILSIRGIHPLYRIPEIMRAREALAAREPVTLVYPFWQDATIAEVRASMRPGDRDLGRVPRGALYAEMRRAALVVSIPSSDSSPRSVYEAIFAGACVALTHHPYVDALPECMRARIIEVNLDDPSWLEGALAIATRVTAQPYLPSEAALEEFDQRRSMQRLARSFYRPVSAKGRLTP